MKLTRFAVLSLLTALAALLFSGRMRITAAPPPSSFVLVAHCGTGDYSKASTAFIESRREGMIVAIKQGYAILAAGGTSLDAVETTIRSMEDSGLYDAGCGAYYTRAGIPEMDAAIMDGRTLAAGSVASLQHIANPIHLARLVMEKTPHVMLVGPGAEEFAESQGIELVSPFYFYNERLWESYTKAKSAEEKEQSSALKGDRDGEHSTVGVVALDQQENLAAGTSTGGTVMKMPGRVGDPNRFQHSRDVGAYLGLTPRRRQSGDIDQQLRISKAGNRKLRSLLVQCAQYLLGRFGPDTDLKRWGSRMAGVEARTRRSAL
jgi:L-asparaginase / beta-aspartyl-peptidase